MLRSLIHPWTEICLDSVVENFTVIQKKRSQHQGIFAVVKDDAYGCGAVPISQVLQKAGAAGFVVVRMHEAKSLRLAGIHLPILVLGQCSKKELAYAHEHHISISLNDLDSLKLMQQVPCTVHINIDTGMRRMGIFPHELSQALCILNDSPHITLEGAFTHFASADEPHTETFAFQYEQFNEALKTIFDAQMNLKYVHTANSAATLRFTIPYDHYSRVGIALYGCKPDPQQDFEVDLKQVMHLKAPIVKIKKVPQNTAISYGGTFITRHDSRIATIPIGYAHGYPRALGNRGEVLIQGRRFPIVGRVTMDYCMIDITSNPRIQVGDEVVAMGTQGTECITTDHIAILANTIGYEILCNSTQRIDRLYRYQNRVIEQNSISMD